MITYQKYILDNGLVVLTHEAWDTPLATVNLLYNVGARDEDPSRTGFAHLFEHLMFGGTERVPDFDAVVSSLGGENNASTNNDITNYYITLPAQGLPTALMLEADRMEGLSLTQKALEVQQHVVTEEYNQRYMNRPYGDMWLMMRPLCYTAHPYRWPTIGADIRHVSEATLEDVTAFHRRFYRADNAVLAVAAPMSHEAIIREVERAWHCSGSRWEGDRPYAAERSYAAEPVQESARRQEAQRLVPATALYMAWPMCDRFSDDFRACDLISDLLGNGKSSRFYNRLVRPNRLFSEVDAFITGDAGPGLLLVSAKLLDGIDIEDAAEAIRAEVSALAAHGVGEEELRKVQGKYEVTHAYSQYKAADRAFALAYNTWLGCTEWVNSEPSLYHAVSPARLQRAAQHLFDPQHENLLIIKN